jgi:hypothetical protein
MRPTSLVHRVLIVAFAAWVSLCCCEKRILAQSLCDDGEAARSSAPACCPSSCCESGDGDAPRDDDGHPGNCADGCCRKTSASLPSWTVDIDAVGVPLLQCIASMEAATDDAGRVLAHDDRTSGEPPPRLALVISRRLRI